MTNSKIIKKFICFILALITVFASCSFSFAYNPYSRTTTNTDTYNYGGLSEYTYRWTKVESETEIFEMLRLNSGAKDNKHLNTDMTTTEDAANILIVYTASDGNNYFLTGGNETGFSTKLTRIYSSSDDAGGSAAGEGVCVIDGFSTSCESFKTRNSLNTPLIKYVKEEHSHSGGTNKATDYLIFSESVGTDTAVALSSMYSLAGNYYFDQSYGDKVFNKKFKGKGQVAYAKYLINFPYGNFEALEISTASVKNKASQNTLLSRQLSVNIAFSKTLSSGGAVFYYEPTKKITSYSSHIVQKIGSKTVDFNTNVYNSLSWIPFWHVSYESFGTSINNRTYGYNLNVRQLPEATDANASTVFSTAVDLDWSLYNVSGYPDYGDGSAYIGSDVVLGTMQSSSTFTIYMAQKVSAPTITSRSAINGVKILTDGTNLDASADPIYVTQGNTLVIEDECALKGSLIIDGGTLIVKGCLRTNDGSSTISAIHNGTIIVQKSGASLSQGSNTMSINLISGGTMFNSGLVCGDGGFKIGAQSMLYETYSARATKSRDLIGNSFNYVQYIEAEKLPSEVCTTETAPDLESGTNARFYKSTSK